MSENVKITLVVAFAIIAVAVVVGFFGNQSARAYQEQYTDRFNVCVESGNSAVECASSETVRVGK